MMLAALGDLVEDIVVRLDGPVNVASDTPAQISRRRGGSAANVAVATAGLGHGARFLGQVGSDAIGSALLAEMTADGVDIAMVQRAGSTGTIVALVDQTGERSMLTDRRTCIDLSDPDPSWLDGVGALHVPLYSLATGAIAATAITVIGWAHERNIDVSIDVSSSAVMREMGIDRVRQLLADVSPDLILANLDEATTLRIDGVIDSAVTIVKQGPDPAVVYSPTRPSVEVPGLVVADVSDTTG
ncbi:MAG TPA: carbohydrate kinase family protein, partial [Ilumatobacteraceae bacterium]|nr:carbohydrate kinase family protein [Ilumatobacteraceae bacterium]